MRATTTKKHFDVYILNLEVMEKMERCQNPNNNRIWEINLIRFNSIESDGVIQSQTNRFSILVRFDAHIILLCVCHHHLSINACELQLFSTAGAWNVWKCARERPKTKSQMKLDRNIEASKYQLANQTDRNKRDDRIGRKKIFDHERKKFPLHHYSYPKAFVLPCRKRQTLSTYSKTLYKIGESKQTELVACKQTTDEINTRTRASYSDHITSNVITLSQCGIVCEWSEWQDKDNSHHFKEWISEAGRDKERPGKRECVQTE